MCTSCDATFKIFAVEIATQEPVDTNMDLYEEIAHRLFQNKVISHISIGHNKAYTVDDRNLFGFELHLGNKQNPLAITLDNVEYALQGLLDDFAGYEAMQINAK